MMLSLVGLLRLILAILACVWAVRTDKSRTLVVLFAIAGAFAGGIFALIPLVQMAAGTGDGADNILYQLGNVLLNSAIMGAFVGIVGIVVQKIIQQRARRA